MIKINRNAKLASMIVLAAALAACEGVQNPVEPSATGAGAAGGAGAGSSMDTDLIATLSTTLVASEQLDVSFAGTAPVGDQASEAGSLLVSVIDLLGIGGPLFSTSGDGTTTSDGNLQEGEEYSASGTIKTRSYRVKYSDGTSALRTETTLSNFAVTGKQSGTTCRSQDQDNFQADNPEGATTFGQQAQIVTKCPGTRAAVIHVNLHFTTPPGKTAPTANVSHVVVKNG
jgi:hypothetical protein